LTGLTGAFITHTPVSHHNLSHQTSTHQNPTPQLENKRKWSQTQAGCDACVIKLFMAGPVGAVRLAVRWAEWFLLAVHVVERVRGRVHV
jgi:hypothetical protein